MNPYASLAAHLKMTVFKIDPPIFVDPEGKKWMLTKYGFTPNEAFSIRERFDTNGVLFRKKEEELNTFLVKYQELKKKVKIFEETGEDLISRRSRKNIKEILMSDISDSEKVLRLKRYLTGGDDT